MSVQITVFFFFPSLFGPFYSISLCILACVRECLNALY